VAGLLAYCRAGFEKDLANEIQEKAANLSVFGFPRLKSNTGYVEFECYQADDMDKLAKELLLDGLVFARQLFVFSHKLEDLSAEDRISPILELCQAYPVCGEVRVEHADTTEGRELSRFCRKFTVPLRQALRKAGKLSDKPKKNAPVLHAFFVDGQQAYVGYSYPSNNSPYALGILRLKFPSDAPSRSTLKLDEAFQLFIPKHEHEERLKSGINAVDLGACPGGWTYQLVKRGMFIQAIDNGLMADSLMESGQVRHFAEDGFKFEPKKKNVYWLVCDMIEKPDRVAALMARWIIAGWCREAMFNLKLPMKRRYESVQESLAVIENLMEKNQVKQYQIQAKHLYHDREEVTVHLRKI